MKRITITLTVTFEQLDEITKILRDSPQARYYKRNKDEVNKRRRTKPAADTGSLPKQEAAAGKSTPERYARYVGYRNVDGEDCVVRVDGTLERLDWQLERNKGLKPRWVSEPMSTEEGLTWGLENTVTGDKTNSWRSV